MEALLSNSEVREIVQWVFGAGLVTGLLVFLLAYSIGSALKIFKF